MIIKLLTFDPFPDIDGFYEKVFKLEKGDPYMEKAAEVGYESRLLSFNAGSVLIFSLLMVANQLVYLLIRVTCSKKTVICGWNPNSWASRHQSNFVWSGACDYIEETYLLCVVGIALNRDTLSFSSPGLFLNDSFATLAGLVTFFFPIVISIRMHLVQTFNVDLIKAYLDPDMAYVDHVYMENPPEIIAA